MMMGPMPGPMTHVLERSEGNGGPPSGLAPLMDLLLSAPVDPDEIARKVKEFEDTYALLFQRMDSDYDLLQLSPYNANEDGSDTFRSYTSNQPRTLAKKIISLLSSAKIIIRVPQAEANKDERARYDKKERVLFGFFNQIDERLVKRLEKPLKEQASTYSAIRGWVVSRNLIVKKPDGTQVVDVTPWDARFTSFGLGGDGLSWAAYKTQKSVRQIEGEWGQRLDGKDEDLYDIIDYYDTRDNTVIAMGRAETSFTNVDGRTHAQVIKPPTPHISKEVPVVIVPVGPFPVFESTSHEKAVASYGESIFAENRGIYAPNNEIRSIYLELLAKARDRTWILKSPDGEKTIEENPNETGGLIPLSSADDLSLADLAETTKDAAIFAGMVGDELQMGGLPKTSYGEVQFTLSGFAINSLRQAVFGVLQPLLDALEWYYRRVGEQLLDQYVSGAFDPMVLSGRGNNRQYFSEQISWEELKDLPPAEFRLVAQLPQADMEKMQLAQLAREGQFPLLSDPYILDEYLGVPDVNAMLDSVKEQIAERASPIAMNYTLMASSEERGRDDLASIYLSEIQLEELTKTLELMQKQMALMQTQMMMMMGQGGPAGGPPGQPSPPAPPGQGSQPRPSRPRPSILPPAQQGIPPNAPNPNSIPARPPGQQRPGRI